MTDRINPIADGLDFPQLVNRINADETFTINIIGLINAEQATTRKPPMINMKRHPRNGAEWSSSAATTVPLEFFHNVK